MVGNVANLAPVTDEMLRRSPSSDWLMIRGNYRAWNYSELAGITREYLFEVGKDVGIAVREQSLRDADLFGADEAFLTSTTRELVPIVHVDKRTIGDGQPGPVTKTLLQDFRRKAHEGED